MDFRTFIQRWRQTTHVFDSADQWRKRLELLGIKSDSDMKTFYNESLNPKTAQGGISESMHYFYNIKSDGQHASIDLIVAKELCSYAEEVLKNLNLSLSLDYKAKKSLHDNFLSSLSSITAPLYEFEYKVFKKAFHDDNFDFTQFLSIITYKINWRKYFLDSYPMIFSNIDTYVTNCKKNILQFAERLRLDIDEIREVFAIDQNLTTIEDLNPFCGDFHNNGESTISITFSNSYNSTSTIYYKPRSLQTDMLWNELVGSLVNMGLPSSMIPTNNIDKINYGWQKGVHQNLKYNNFKEVESLCYKQGINIGLAYIFGVQDLISDNIIINGDTPIFIDLEMILSPLNKSMGDFRSDSVIAKHFINGIIKTGMVPCYGFETLDNPGYDNCGLSAIKGLIADSPEKATLTERICKNLIRGFSDFYKFVSVHKKEILEFFTELEINKRNLFTRYLVRYSFNYAQILKVQNSPLCQSDYLERFLALENLWRAFDPIIMNDKIIMDELRQLSMGDIPLFKTKLGENDLYNNKGDIIFKHYFLENGISACINRIKQFSEDEYNLQCGVLKRSLYIHNYSKTVDSLNSISFKFNKNRDLLHQIVEYIYSLDLHFKDEKYFCYTDFTIGKDDVWDQGVQHLDLFQGILGVGIFLMAWYKYSEDVKAKQMVFQIYNEAIEFLRNNKCKLLDSPVAKLGIMQFPTALLYFCTMGRKILGDTAPLMCLEDLTFILEYIEAKYEKDIYIDYFSGSTGAILVLMDYYNFAPSNFLKQLIMSMGKQLIKTSTIIKPYMVSWKKRFFSFWGGFAHGNSSISYVLFRLWQFSGDKKFYNYGIRALRYDQSLFDPVAGLWNKTFIEKGDTHHSWGSGSAGIALSRHLISQFYHNSKMDNEICTAINIIKDQIHNKKYTDHSIGSGLMGLVEIASILDENFNVKQCIETDIESLNFSEIICGGWKENPPITGLYYGYSGIGYSILKLKYNIPLPSLLWI